MKQEPAPTLSAHLLVEASRFFLYPKRTYRTNTNLHLREYLDEGLHRLTEWRKTFAPQELRAAVQGLVDNPVLLDQFYSCELLRQVPGIVARTKCLAHLTMGGITGEGFIHLRNAANCYIFGLYQAAAALARAAVETEVRTAAEGSFGRTTVGALELKDLLDRVGARLLTPEGLLRAHKIRRAANATLHENQVPSSDEAFELVESARLVIGELAGRPANKRMEPTRR